MLLQKQNRLAFLKIIGCLLLLNACGKRAPKETLLQRAERIINTTAEKYKQEVALVAAEKDEKKVKKQLGKIVEDRPVKWKKMDTFSTIFVGQSYSPEKTPFHRYIKVLCSDIDRLQSNERFLIKLGLTALLERSKDLRCMLLEIKRYLMKHKEYKAEDRFAALRGELTSQRRY
jgi:hypothetical protein